MVFHEYLGIANYERNILEYSQYPISQRILAYAFEKKTYELRMERKIIDCVLQKEDKSKIGKVFGPGSKLINNLLDSGMPEMTRIRLYLNEDEAPAGKLGKSLNMEITSGISKAAGITKPYVTDKKAYFGDIGQWIVPEVKKFSEKRVVTSESDEVEEEILDFDLEKHTLVVKERKAYFFFGPKRTVKKTRYTCELR